VLLPAVVWRELEGLGRGQADAPVFPSRRGGGHLHPTSVERIVLKAAKRAGLEGKVSPHWLRHAHATHALERGAPIHLGRRHAGPRLGGHHPPLPARAAD
jgi:integrase/recombinase XerD